MTSSKYLMECENSDGAFACGIECGEACHSEDMAWLHGMVPLRTIFLYMTRMKQLTIIGDLRYRKAEELVCTALAAQSFKQNIYPFAGLQNFTNLFACSFSFPALDSLGDVRLRRSPSGENCDFYTQSSSKSFQWGCSLGYSVQFSVGLKLAVTSDGNSSLAWIADCSSPVDGMLDFGGQTYLEMMLTGCVSVSSSLVKILPCRQCFGLNHQLGDGKCSLFGKDHEIMQVLRHGNPLRCILKFELTCAGIEQNVSCID